MQKNFELLQVDKFRKFSQGQGVILGPGDDAAVVSSCNPQDTEFVFCGDMVIENVHFDRNQLTSYEIGRKAVARTLSDIAAMGAKAKYMGFSLAIPKSDRDQIDDLLQGARDLLAEFDCSLVGGDISKANTIICDTWCLGTVDKGCYVTRAGAKADDLIFVSGKLGGSYSSKRHATFMPQIQKASCLVSKYKINSMIDISDGLVFDLYRILADSGVGACLNADSVPLNDGCKLNDALYDGEDYVLLFTADSKYKDNLVDDGMYCIGQIKSGDVRLYLENGKSLELLERDGFSSLS